MIKSEYFRTRKDGVRLYRTYSDCGAKILQNETGALYDEAIDVGDAPYTYSEAAGAAEDIPDSEALAIITGGTTV